MKTKHNKFLIISMMILFVGGVYLYFSNDLNSGPIVQVAYGSSLGSTTGTAVSPLASLSSSDKISSDIAFLTTLVSLKNIKIDTSLFTDKSFMILQDNTVTLDKVEPGRVNPFSPIDTYNTTNNPVSPPKVVTNQATQITDKTVVLNGTINSTSVVTDAYFEYGTTLNLGTITPIIKPSLVGTFIKNVLGLISKTNYFSRACAKINNIATCGDVVSFTTN